MDYRKTGLEVLEAVGGKDNVAMLTHCATRLRFEFRDKGKGTGTGWRKYPGSSALLTREDSFR